MGYLDDTNLKISYIITAHIYIDELMTNAILNILGITDEKVRGFFFNSRNFSNHNKIELLKLIKNDSSEDKERRGDLRKLAENRNKVAHKFHFEPRSLNDLIDLISPKKEYRKSETKEIDQYYEESMEIYDRLTVYLTWLRSKDEYKNIYDEIHNSISVGTTDD